MYNSCENTSHTVYFWWECYTLATISALYQAAFKGMPCAYFSWTYCKVCCVENVMFIGRYPPWIKTLIASDSFQRCYSLWTNEEGWWVYVYILCSEYIVNVYSIVMTCIPTCHQPEMSTSNDEFVAMHTHCIEVSFQCMNMSWSYM